MSVRFLIAVPWLFLGSNRWGKRIGPAPALVGILQTEESNSNGRAILSPIVADRPEIRTEELSSVRVKSPFPVAWTG